jgi:hypothetical protein
MAKTGTTRYYSDLQEREIEQFLGLKQQVNSGATLFKKGDNYDDYMVLDAKTQMTDKASFTMKEDWFDKIKEEAFGMGRMFSGVAFRFGPRRKDYVAVPIDIFNELYQSWLREQENL